MLIRILNDDYNDGDYRIDDGCGRGMILIRLIIKMIMITLKRKNE